MSIFFCALFFAQNNTVHEKEIQEVVLKSKAPKYKNKKENPAFDIMRKVWEHKRKNGLENFETYSYKEYEKIEFDLSNIDSTFMNRKIFNKMEFIFDYTDSMDTGNLALPMFLNEAVYNNYGTKSPQKKVQREIVAQKTSGFQDNEVVALTAKNLYKDINIYDNTLNFFNIGFPSPVSRDGFSVYDYVLLDSLFVNGNESYRIQYFPKRKDVLAFQGYLYISTDNYSVVRATLRSTKNMNVNFVNAIKTDLEFENPDDETFLPKKIKMEFDLSFISKKKDAKGIIAKRSVDYSEYVFNQPLDPKIFENKEDPRENIQLEKPDSYWQAARTDSLDSVEQGIYDMLDHLQTVPKFNRMVNLYETLSSGYYNVGNAVDIGNLYSTFGYNEVEGFRLRFGARTYFSQNDMWRLQGYGAYGFNDNKFKYAAEGKFMFNKVNRFMMGLGTRRDILQLGVQLTTDDGIMTRSFASSAIFGRGSNASLSDVNQTNFFTAIEPWKNFQVRLDGSIQSIKSANPTGFDLDYYKDGHLRHTLLDTHATVSLIARPGAKFSKTGVERWEHTTLAPTFVLKYTRGIEGLFNGDFNYNKLQFMYTQPILLGIWGKTLVNLEAGKNFDTVPLAIQNVIPGNQSYGLVPNTFAQLNYYEFVTDTYTTLHLEHHFNGKILSYIPLIKKLKLREVAFLRGAYGTLSDASKAINVAGNLYSAPSEQIYYEYGFGIENIGLGNLRIFRIDFNWRGNYLDKPDVSRFGIKAGFQFDF